MTLIVGVNLSDRIYLGADSRVTNESGTLNDDTVIKHAVLYSDSNNPSKEVICMAVAGKLDFAKYIYYRLKEGFDSHELNSDIREFSADIEKFLRPHIDNWLKRGNSNKGCFLIFGGSTQKRNKFVDANKFKALANDHFKKRYNPDLLSRIARQENEIPFLKKFNEENKKQTGLSLSQQLVENAKPYLAPYIAEAMASGSFPILPTIPDSYLFALNISPKDFIFSKIESEWGTYIAAGSNGLREGHLPNDFLSIQEFGRMNNIPSHLFETAIISTTIKDMALKHGLTSRIGGTVSILAIKDSRCQAFFNSMDTSEDAGVLYYKRPSNILLRMEPFYKWKESNLQLVAEAQI